MESARLSQTGRLTGRQTESAVLSLAAQLPHERTNEHIKGHMQCKRAKQNKRERHNRTAYSSNSNANTSSSPIPIPSSAPNPSSTPQIPNAFSPSSTLESSARVRRERREEAEDWAVRSG